MKLTRSPRFASFARSSRPLLALFAASCCATFVIAAPIYEPLAAFEAGPENPNAGKLLLHTDGDFYGSSPTGGAYGLGTIYRVTPAGEVSVLAHFTGTGGRSPQGHLASDGSGFLWGITPVGGASNFGTIFKVNVSTGALATVLQFTGTSGAARGNFPQSGLLSDGNGSFWGTTLLGGTANNGSVYKVNMTTGVLTTVVSFTGASGVARGFAPRAGLVSDDNGFFWGTTVGNGVQRGTVFKVNTATGVLTTLATLSGSGASGTGDRPLGELVADGAGYFWGTASEGGESFGTVFKVNIATGELTRVVAFTAYDAVPGGTPHAGLAKDAGGFLWGTTWWRGTFNFGTVFKINPGTGVLTTVFNFDGDHGATPEAELVSDGNGFVWGTTKDGGTGSTYGGGRGTVFKVDTSSDALTTMAELGTSAGPVTGSHPQGGLASDASGRLWGTTEEGGVAGFGIGFGTIFSLHPGTGALSQVVRFTGNSGVAKGISPDGKLLNDGSGSFWGTTFGGGYWGHGTIFRVNHDTGALTTVIEFTGGLEGAKGTGPIAGLVSDGSGFFWGTTRSGSPYDLGTIFKVNASTGALTTVVEFTGSSGTALGSYPFGALISDGSGFLWGTSEQGGTQNLGTVFKVNQSTGELTTAVSFTGVGGVAKGKYPDAGLISDGNGFFWGTTFFGGTADQGTVFKLQTSTNELTTLVSFTGLGGVARGSNPTAGLAMDGGGAFWGTTRGGGTVLLGTIFKVTNAGAFTNVFNFTGVSGPVPGEAPGFGSLFLHSDGHMYGTTAKGGRTPGGHPAGNGQIFRLRFGPTPVTEPATPIASNTATLRGTLNPNGIVTTASFEWGTDPMLPTSSIASAGTTSAGTSPVAVSANLTGLGGGATYYYRMVGVNAENTQPQRGAILSFITPLSPLQQWKLAHLGDANAPDSGDPDDDGLSTLAEYGLNLLPGTPDAATPAWTRFNYAEGERLRVFIQRDPARNDVSIEVQAADGPGGPWTVIAASTLGAPFSGPGYVVGDDLTPGVKTVEIRDTAIIADAPRRFLRVEFLR